MRILVAAGLLLLFAAPARALEDEDDPKSMRGKPVPRASAAPAARPAKPEPPARPEPPAKPEPAPAKPEPAAAKPAKPSAKPAAMAVAPRRELLSNDLDEVMRPGWQNDADLKMPSFDPEAALLPPSPSPRAVKVKMVDGAQVTGTVLYEQADTLVIDCPLGRLAIPRARVSSIVYENAKPGAARKPTP